MNVWPSPVLNEVGPALSCLAAAGLMSLAGDVGRELPLAGGRAGHDDAAVARPWGCRGGQGCAALSPVPAGECRPAGSGEVAGVLAELLLGPGGQAGPEVASGAEEFLFVCCGHGPGVQEVQRHPQAQPGGVGRQVLPVGG